jgi:hypothetical protein
MGQLGFFYLNRRYESLTEKNDPLLAIAAMVPFESFRPKACPHTRGLMYATECRLAGRSLSGRRDLLSACCARRGSLFDE